MSEKKTVILVVSVGTNIIRAKAAAYDKIVEDLAQYSSLPVWQAFTDDDTAAAMTGSTANDKIYTVEGALETAIAQTVRFSRVWMNGGDVKAEMDREIHAYI